MTKRDIQSRDDIMLIVDSFYKMATDDPLIGHFFQKHISKDLETHLPIIYNFWESVLLAAANYRGNPMHTHIDLNKKSPLNPEHFDRWIALWNANLDQKFCGSKVEEAKKKASMMRELMLFKIKRSKDSGFVQ